MSREGGWTEREAEPWWTIKRLTSQMSNSREANLLSSPQNPIPVISVGGSAGTGSIDDLLAAEVVTAEVRCSSRPGRAERPW